MKIKSLLLGSAAALIAVTGARAADAVIVEPEPVEYVRICDAYGAGFFYIPGTETCLKFSGYVRVDYRGLTYHDNQVTSRVPTHRHRVLYRGRLNIDARNETEWGTLRSQLRFQGDGGSGYSAEDVFSDGNASFHGHSDAGVGIDRALISLAGFRLGYSDDYWTTIGGYGFYRAHNDGIYSYGQAAFFDYTYAADGFTLTAGLQVAAGATELTDNILGYRVPNGNFAVNGSGLAGQPDLYVGADYSGSWGRVYGTYYYDSNGYNSGTGEGAGAWKVGAELNLADYLPGGAIKGWYMADNGDTDYVHGHAWGVSAQMDLTDNLVLFSGYSDWDRTDGDTPGTDQTVWTSGVRWNMAPGLYSQVEYAKYNRSGQLGHGQYVVRVVRSF